jgi:DNA-binding transcriptional LysR family regulator
MQSRTTSLLGLPATHGGYEQLPKAALFVAVVRAGSLVGAGRALGLARSTVSDHLQALEEAVGARLLERTTRRLRLTEEGEILFARMSEALDSWQEAREALEERRAEPMGLLRVATLSGLVSTLVGPAFGAYLARYPKVSAELLVDDTIQDLVAERIDVAVRMAPLVDSELVARPLGETSSIVVASPALAARARAGPRAAEGLPWVGHADVRSEQVVLTRVGSKRRITLRPRFKAHASTTEGEIALVEAGAGVALMPRILVEGAIAAGRLVRALPSYAGRILPFYVIYRTRTYQPARISRFLDALRDAARR